MDATTMFRKNVYVFIPSKSSKVQVTDQTENIKTVSADERKISKGTEYAEQYKDAELCIEAKPKSGCDMDNVTAVFSALTPSYDNFYLKYNFDADRKSKLPIAKYKNTILQMSRLHNVCIITGNTGCGKSTQVPQYILDDFCSKKQWCNIIVTQPRRLAAITVANRVCQERHWCIGSVVGYQVGFDKNAGEDTRLLYCTTGVLLNKLIYERSLEQYSHIIIDEVHERDQDMDFSLLLIKKLQSQSNAKVILMSATADTNRLTEYFGPSVYSMNIDLKANFEVGLHYFDDFVSVNSELNIDWRVKEPMFHRELCDVVCTLLKRFDRFDQKDKEPNEITEIVNVSNCSVLIFLPGIYEIEDLDKYLKENYNTPSNHSRSKLEIHVLHSLINSQEQENIFQKAVPGYRKVILSTNIAESSITIPDVKYVIDFCLTKELNYDRKTNLTCLQLQWCSKSNCQQRAGRVGRVMPGHVYRLIPKQLYNSLPPFATPEILRSPLDKLILKCKMLEIYEPKVIFASALDVPDLSNIENDVLILKEIGALMPMTKDRYKTDDGDLTRLGRIIAQLPLDCHLGKLIVLGFIFGVYEECIIIACCLSVRNIFVAQFRQYLEAYDSKLFASKSSESDCIALLNIFNLWKKVEEGKSPHGIKKFIAEHFVSLKSLQEASKLYDEIKLRLLHSQIEECHKPYGRKLDEAQKAAVLKIVLAGSFYPNYFTYNGTGDRIDERGAVKAVGGYSPHNSVFLRGLPRDQPGSLYVKFIKDYFSKVADEVDVKFDISNNGFIYVCCKNAKHYLLNGEVPQVPGKISLGVYRAIKMRHLEKQISIPVLPVNVAKEKMNILQEKAAESPEQPLSMFSPLTYPWDKTGNIYDSNYVKIIIKYVENPSKFWAQLANNERVQKFEEINNMLNAANSLVAVNRITIGSVYVALFEGKYYRCRVISKMANAYSCCYTVFYIDYGNTEVIPAKNIKGFGPELLRHMFDTIPGFVVECRLSEIEPVVDGYNTHAQWNAKANQIFHQYLETPLNALIYSVVDNVAVLIVYLSTSDGRASNMSLNQMLIKQNCAVPVNEDYLSQFDHMKRLEAKITDRKVKAESSNPLLKLAEQEGPSYDECKNDKCENLAMHLQGPFSPLEVSLRPTTRGNISRNVKVARDSINSVLLHENPQDQFERLVVASHVSIRPDGDSLSLRNTTQMMPLRGFSALVYLLFAPTVELRMNKERTRYIGALCGLGYDPNTGESLFPEHDVEVIFDANFVLDDIECINRLRAYFNIAMLDDGARSERFSEQTPAFNYLFRLLRRYQRQESCKPFDIPYKWNCIPDNYLLPPYGDGTYVRSDSQDIYKLISGIDLCDPIPSVPEIWKNLSDFDKMLIGENPSGYNIFVCTLCQEPIANQEEARLHKNTRLHNEIVDTFRAKYSRIQQ